MPHSSPIKRRSTRKVYRARGRTTEGAFTPTEWFALCKRFRQRCACCRQKKPLTVDHIVPVSKGGTSDISNIQPLCDSCNQRKGDRTIDYRTGMGEAP